MATVPIINPKRPLNDFETFFASNNVRFAVLYVGEVKSLEEGVVLRRLRRFSRLGSLSLTTSKNEVRNDAWFMENSGCGASVYTTSIKEGEALNNRFLSHLVSAESGDATKSLQIGLFTRDGTTIGIYINASHALVDGKSMLHLLTGLLADHNDEEHQPRASAHWPMLLRDWKEFVEESYSSTLLHLDETPTFLITTSEFPVLSAHELTVSATSERDRSFPRDFQHALEFDALCRVQSVGKQHSASVTAVVAACLMFSMACVYGKRDRHVGMSVLVDLRPFITAKLGDHDTLNQAIGTVTLSLDCARMLDTQAPNDILMVASELTEQLRLRIQRGEAHRSALRLCSGDFEHSAPPATMELSNLGYLADMTEGKLYVAQRFDGYDDGIACMSYTTPTQGLVCQTSVGSGLNAAVTSEVIDKAFKCLRDVELYATGPP